VGKIPKVKLLRYLESKLGCVLVNSAGNTGRTAHRHADKSAPAIWRYTGQLPNMLVVGATGIHGLRSEVSLPLSDGTDNGVTFAPGQGLYSAWNKNENDGTSFC
jgi:hypothetical protein